MPSGAADSVLFAIISVLLAERAKLLWRFQSYIRIYNTVRNEYQ